MLAPHPADLRQFLAGRPPRANAAPDPWALVRRAVAGAGRPARPHLARTLQVVRDATGSPWGALIEAGLVPWEWLGDASRGFVRREGRVVGVMLPGLDRVTRKIESVSSTYTVFVSETSEHLRPGDLVTKRSNAYEAPYVRALVDEPDGADAAAALASDAGNVLVAEEFARQAAQAMVPWGAQPVASVAWQMLEPYEGFAPQRSGDLLDRIGANVCSAAGRSRRNAEAVNALLSAAPVPLSEGCVPELRGLIFDYLSWAGAAARRLRIQYAASFGPDVIKRLIGVRYRDLPNPFEPLLELAALGYSARSPIGPFVVVFAPSLPGAAS